MKIVDDFVNDVIKTANKDILNTNNKSILIIKYRDTFIWNSTTESYRIDDHKTLSKLFPDASYELLDQLNKNVAQLFKTYSDLNKYNQPYDIDALILEKFEKLEQDNEVLVTIDNDKLILFYQNKQIIDAIKLFDNLAYDSEIIDDWGVNLAYNKEYNKNIYINFQYHTRPIVSVKLPITWSKIDPFYICLMDRTVYYYDSIISFNERMPIINEYVKIINGIFNN